ncbi:hypothetical protein D1007_08894 [Hordeum vulgare]|nr:hypothetical protein D1007_08894 [Hordeum vulgare]
MYLARWWKLFALTLGLKEGHVLYFKSDGAATLFVKIFGRKGDRMDCCMEIGSIGCSSSSFDGGNGTSSERYGRDVSQGARIKEETRTRGRWH